MQAFIYGLLAAHGIYLGPGTQVKINDLQAGTNLSCGGFSVTASPEETFVGIGPTGVVKFDDGGNTSITITAADGSIKCRQLIEEPPVMEKK